MMVLTDGCSGATGPHGGPRVVDPSPTRAVPTPGRRAPLARAALLLCALPWGSTAQAAGRCTYNGKPADFVTCIYQEMQDLEDDLGADIASLEATVSDLETQLAAAQATLAAREAELATAQATVAALEVDIVEAEGSLATLASDIETQADTLTTLEAAVLTSADLDGRATQAWVAGQGYGLAATSDDNAADIAAIQADHLTTAALDGYATETWIDGQAYCLDLDVDANTALIETTQSAVDANAVDLATLSAQADANADDLGTTTDDLCEVAGAMDLCALVDACPGPCSQYVFATSATYDGDLDGIDGADALCQAHADAAGLDGTYLAWLSTATATDAPDSRFTHATLPYTLVDGTTIADDWDDLVDSALAAGIDLDENGDAVSGTAWSSVDGDGSQRTTSTNLMCSSWSATNGVTGQQGTLGATDTSWTFNGQAKFCSTTAHLLCFEQ